MANYPFNGNSNDESGNGNDGTVYGATLTTDGFGNPNSAYFFNEDYILVPYSDTLSLTNSFSLIANIKAIDFVDGYSNTI
ncbi:hypothetical protein D1BOALGB6SA_5188 [Olavius sp. associated proteobacterium Delta 1]|nr:hypothetical protein D1BOALGB6SA_5188 [Olavius sp. associated proteobacterium Delta 1]